MNEAENCALCFQNSNLHLSVETLRAHPQYWFASSAQLTGSGCISHSLSHFGAILLLLLQKLPNSQKDMSAVSFIFCFSQCGDRESLQSDFRLAQLVPKFKATRVPNLASMFSLKQHIL